MLKFWQPLTLVLVNFLIRKINQVAIIHPYSALLSVGMNMAAYFRIMGLRIVGLIIVFISLPDAPRNIFEGPAKHAISSSVSTVS